MPLIFYLKNLIYRLAKEKNTDNSQLIHSLNHCLDCLMTEDPISREGWRFFHYYQTPFLELQEDSKAEYWEQQEQAKKIREEIFCDIREKYGIPALIGLINCMEDDTRWGTFIGENMTDEEIMIVAQAIDVNEKTQLIAGIIDYADLSVAAKMYELYSNEEKKLIVPFLYRDDIDSWLDTPELEYLYWRTKRITEYDERAYHYLLKYNPCGILSLFHKKTNDASAFKQLIEVVRAILSQNSCTDPGLLKYTVKQFDKEFYIWNGKKTD